MNILALDLGNKFRFAVYKDGNVSFGSHRLSCKGFWTRFLKFRTWLLGIIKQNQIELVCFERVYRNKSQAAPMPKDLNIVVNRHVSMLSAICSELGVKCKGFSVGSIKKYITGGNKTKENMLSQAVPGCQAAPGRNVLGISGKRRASALRGLLLLGKNSGKNCVKKCDKNISRVLRNQRLERVSYPRGFSSVRIFSKVDRNKNKSNASKIIKIKNLSRHLNDIEDGCND